MRWEIFLLAVFTLTSVSGAGLVNADADRQGKFFNLFNIVKFENAPCYIEDGQLNGTCYADWECSDKGGEDKGNCAAGFGSCCFISCWEDRCSVDEPIAYFENENYPQRNEPEADSIKYTVKVTDENVCQVRIDLVDFDLAPQTAKGDCEDQYLTIEGVDGVGQMCGDNTDQHVYVPIDSVPATIDLNVVISSDTKDFDYKYRIKATQVDCTSNDDYMKEIKAPDGCTQYYTDTSGSIKSFNYDGENMYQQNQDYAICIAKEANMCGVKYTNPEKDKARSIGLAEQTKCDGAKEDGTAVAGTKESGCGEDCLDQGSEGEGDFIAVAMGQVADYKDFDSAKSYAAYYCGQGLGADVVDDAAGTADNEVEGDGVRDYSGGPFVLYFHTDNLSTNTTGSSGTSSKAQSNLGFEINYAVQTGNCR